MQAFSIKESLRFGWEKTKANFWFVVGVSVVYLLISSIGPDKERPEPWEVILGIVGFFVMVAVQMGYTRIFLKLHDGGKPAFRELFTGYQPYWRYMGTYILYCLIVIGGLILLIVPGIIWAIKYFFALPIVLEKGTRPMESLRASAAMTEGRKMHIFKFWLAIVGIIVAYFALFALFVIGIFGLALERSFEGVIFAAPLPLLGFVVIVPVLTFAYVFAYRRHQAASEPVVVAPIDTAPQAPSPDTTIAA